MTSRRFASATSFSGSLTVTNDGRLASLTSTGFAGLPSFAMYEATSAARSSFASDTSSV